MKPSSIGVPARADTVRMIDLGLMIMGDPYAVRFIRVPSFVRDFIRKAASPTEFHADRFGTD
jgi:hypothetical protein